VRGIPPFWVAMQVVIVFCVLVAGVIAVIKL
jgi:hypothetical protein